MNENENTLDTSRIELLLREHFAKTDRQLAEFRADNAEFKATIIKRFDDLKADNSEFKLSVLNEMNKRFDGITSEMNKRFDNMQAQINVLQNDVTGLKHDVSNLQHWNYWILAVILVVFVLPQFASGVKAFFGAVRDGVLGIRALFKKAQQ